MTRAAYRLVRARHAGGAFDGEGARRFGGRWNPAGLAAVYLASHRSLAVLEILANLERNEALTGFCFFEIRFDESLVERVDRALLPVGWRRPEPPAALARIGAEFLAASRRPLLEVPSALVPAESNYLFNPRHPERASIEIGPAEAFSLDPRLLDGDEA